MTARPSVADVGRSFPGWHVWSSNGGHWYATRRRDLPEKAAKFRLWPTVHAGSLAALWAELDVQEQHAETAVGFLGAGFLGAVS
jgi:hypothetical protein